MNMKYVLPIFLILIGLCSFVQSSATTYVYLTEITSTNFLPSTINPGDVVSLAIDIKNRSELVYLDKLNATLYVGDQFEALDLNKSVDVIRPGFTETVVFRFKVKADTISGYYPAKVSFDYFNTGQLIHEDSSVLIPVTSTGKTISIGTESRIISPGEQTTLSFVLQNLSNNEISNIDFSWKDNASIILPIGSDDRKHVSSLKAYESKTITYDVVTDPSTTTGIYPLILTLVYSDTNGIKTVSSTMGVIVGGGTDFDLSAENNGSNSYTFSIVNIGKNSASAVSLVIPQQKGMSTGTTDTAVLGEITKGDFTVANFTITKTTSSFASGIPAQSTSLQQDRANTNNDINVEIRYTDTLGDRRVIQKTITLPIDSNSSFGSRMKASNTTTSWTTTIIYVIIALVVVVLVYYYYKKKKVIK